MTTTYYRKDFADASRFRPIPESLYNELGGVKKGSARCLVLSWMLGGVRSKEGSVVRFSGGRDVIVAPGEVIGSRLSIQEDIRVATGRKFSYKQLRYCETQLIERGLLVDRGLVNPETNGWHGKRWYIPNVQLMMETTNTVDVVEAYRVFYYGDVSEFNRGEIFIGNPRYDRPAGDARKYGDAQVFVNTIAEQGIAKPAFTTVGRWRKGEEGQMNSPVLVPWFMCDIDRHNDIPQAFEDTIRVTLALGEAGFDLDRVYVSASGGKGFHVALESSQLGSPIFASSEAAREVWREFIGRIVPGVKLDPHVNSPLTLIRLTGSTHEKTGIQKQTWLGSEFLAFNWEEFSRELGNDYRGFRYPDPTAGEVSYDPSLLFYDVAMEYEDRRNRQRQRGGVDSVDVEDQKPGKVIKQILKGVGEGEAFAWDDNGNPLQVGRDRAAFILSCWLLERYEQGEALSRLRAWNRRNRPPLDEEGAFGIEKCLNSAFRTLERKGKLYTQRHRRGTNEKGI